MYSIEADIEDYLSSASGNAHAVKLHVSAGYMDAESNSMERDSDLQATANQLSQQQSQYPTSTFNYKVIQHVQIHLLKHG